LVQQPPQIVQSGQSQPGRRMVWQVSGLAPGHPRRQMRQSPVRLLNHIVKLATMMMTLDDHDLAPHPRVMPVMDRDVDPVILRSVSLS
jgi:hypothetical protein